VNRIVTGIAAVSVACALVLGVLVVKYRVTNERLEHGQREFCRSAGVSVSVGIRGIDVLGPGWDGLISDAIELCLPFYEKALMHDLASFGRFEVILERYDSARHRFRQVAEALERSARHR
jgi:hypothetical protein